MILVTGGAGFIGSNFIHCLLDSSQTSNEGVVNYDKLTYAGNLSNLSKFSNDSRYVFVRGDISDAEKVREVLNTYRPSAIINFAAESHVDRSIHGPREFIQSNIFGVYSLLECCREFWSALEPREKERFRFLHVSTDEVYGSLKENDQPFREDTPFSPNSPYAASKAASDHLVRAWNHTFQLPVLTTNCSNNYGPYQFPEKLIPLIFFNALSGKDLPIYGDGRQIRDWLHVSDHCLAIFAVLNKGRTGETYNIGGWNEIANIEVVKSICSILDELSPRQDGKSYSAQIRFVKDRPGHDRRYAIDASKIHSELGWTPRETFDSGLRKTIEWYIENSDWVRMVADGSYKDWVSLQYGEVK